MADSQEELEEPESDGEEKEKDEETVGEEDVEGEA